MSLETPRKKESSENPFVNEKRLVSEAINFIKSNPELGEDGIGRFLDSLQISSGTKEGIRAGLKKHMVQEQENRTKQTQMRDEMGTRGQQRQGRARNEEERWRGGLNG